MAASKAAAFSYASATEVTCRQPVVTGGGNRWRLLLGRRHVPEFPGEGQALALLDRSLTDSSPGPVRGTGHHDQRPSMAGRSRAFLMVACTRRTHWHRRVKRTPAGLQPRSIVPNGR
jgi:hypothetical protein